MSVLEILLDKEFIAIIQIRKREADNDIGSADLGCDGYSRESLFRDRPVLYCQNRAVQYYFTKRRNFFFVWLGREYAE